MIPTKMSLYQLFERELRYVVPLYQRPYVWSQESEWEPLWNDIQERSNAVLQRRDHRERIQPHFLGAMVIREIDSFGLNVRTFEIIDGQQRLTTLQIFLAVCRDRLAQDDPSGIGHAFRTLTWNERIPDEDEQRLKVWPTNADRVPFAAVMNSGSVGAVNSWGREQRSEWRGLPKMVQAYQYFCQELDLWLDGDGTDDSGASRQQRRESLFEALKKHLHTVSIELEDEDDPQVIFETLNARGQPLLPSDLVRNFIFHAAEREGVNTDALYERLWSRFDDPGPKPFWKEEVTFGREKRERVVLFLFHFLIARTGLDFGVGHLFHHFKRWWHSSDGPTTAEEGLEILNRYATAYEQIVKPVGSARFSLFCRRLETLEISTVNPVLLHLLVDRTLSLGELDQIAAYLESFVIRRQVCRLTSKNLNRFFLTLLRTLRSAEIVDANLVGQALAVGDGTSVAFPDDRAFRRHWLNEPAYKRMRRSNVNLILSALDLQLTTRLQEDVHISSKTTIEHVMPEAWDAHWPISVVTIDTDESDEERRDRLIHTFGNLTLLTQSLNSAVRNGPYSGKRPAITQNSRLHLNAYFQEVPAWDDEAIMKRGGVLFETARQVWPFPSGLSAVTVEAETDPLSIAAVVLTDASRELAGLVGEELRRAGVNSGSVIHGRDYCKLVPERWWPSVHYEFRYRDSQPIIGLHVELPLQHPSRQVVKDSAHGLLGIVRESFPGHQVQWHDHPPVHRYLEVALEAEDATPDRVADGIHRLMAATHPELDPVIRLARRKRL